MRLRSALLILAFTTPVAAQNIASFQVMVESSKVVAGLKTRARAIARDPQGTVINLSYRWSVADAAIASVEFDGTITGINLGITRVRATVTNNVFAETTVQVLPARIEMTPLTARMEVGEQRQFTARALNAAGNPLDAPLRWQVLSGQGFNSNAGSTSANGMVTALAEASLIVRAGFVYNTYIPGLQNEVYAQATLAVGPPAHFEFSRVYRGSSNAARAFSFHSSNLSGNDSGTIVFAAGFDSRANGLAAWDASGLRLLAAGGSPGIALGTSLIDFFNFATNSRGDVAVTAQVAGGGNVLYAARAGEPLQPLVADNSILGGLYEGAGSLRFSRSPLASDGGMTFQANFRNPGETAQYSGVFYQDEYGNVRLVASSEGPLAALGAIPALDGDAFGPAPGGVVYFTASGGGKRGVFRQKDFDKPEKLLATGDSFLGSTIAGLMGSSMFWSGAGGVVFGVQLANGTNHLVLLPGGNVQTALTLRLNSWGAVHGFHPEHGVLFVGSEPNQPYGLRLWKDSVRQIVITGRTQVEGVSVDVIDGAAVDAAGAVTALVRTAAIPQLLARFGSEGATVLIRTGDPVNLAAPDNPWGFVQGGKAGGPHLLIGGTSASIFDLTAGGAPDSRPAFAAGELVTGTWRHTGSATWNSRRGADGKLYVTATTGYGVARKAPGGAVEPVLAGNQRMSDGVFVYSAYEVRANASGQLLTTQGTERGDTRLTLTTNGSTRLVASTDGSTVVEGLGPLSNWSDQQLDDSGRVLALVRGAQGLLALGAWTDGAWRAVLRVGDGIGRWRVSNISNLKIIGDRLFFRVQVQGGAWAVGELTAAGAAVALDVDEIAANGVPVNSVNFYDVNTRGDLLFQASGFGITFYGVKLAREAGFRHIYTNTSLTADGDLPVRLIDGDLRDDSTVYLLFVNLSDEPVLYRAVPR